MHPIYSPELVEAVILERQGHLRRTGAATRARAPRRRHRFGRRGRHPDRD
jgi:hypothetical protein